MPQLKGFVGPASEMASPRADCERLINLFPEKVESENGPNGWVLSATPGLSQWVTGLNGGVRALWAGENRLFCVAGSRLYEVFANGSVTDRGSVGSATTRAKIIPNGSQILVLSNGVPYIDNGTSIVQPAFEWAVGYVDVTGTAATWISGDKFSADMAGKPIAIAGVPNTVAAFVDETHVTLGTAATGAGLGFIVTEPVTASCAAFLDGYYVVAKPSTKQINISAINDGQTWDALDYASKEAYPDNIAQMLADHEELWIFGTSESTEIWRNTGNADFPLERDPGAMIHMATCAPESVIRLALGVAWLGQTSEGGPVAYRAQGYVPQRVSTHAVEAEWDTYSTVADAESVTYRVRGHEMWEISFPTANRTWVYDALTGLWHRRAFGAGYDRSRVRCHAKQFGYDIVGDYATGTLYKQSLAYYTDAGTASPRVRRAPHITDGMRKIFYPQFDLLMEDNSALTTTLSYSNDGGQHFTTPRQEDGRKRSHGNSANILSRQWRRCGSGSDRVFELVVSGNARVCLIDAYI